MAALNVRFGALVPACLYVMISLAGTAAEVNITELDIFLTFNGYLPMPSEDKPVITDGDREAALRFMQFFYNLNVTGRADEATMRVVRTPRCGCEDVTKDDDVKKKMMMRRPRSLLAPQSYQIAKKGWPERRLTWKISKYSNRRIPSPQQQRDAVTRGFSVWARHVPLVFVYVEDSSVDTDFDFRFETGYHLPEVEHHTYAFDGKGNKLAHAFPPTSGMVHFDDDEDFDIRNPEKTDLVFVAAHEIGHALGLYHTGVEGSLMYPTYAFVDEVRLERDDIMGIQALYGRLQDGGDTILTRPTLTPATTLHPYTRIPQPQRPAHCDLVFDATFYNPRERKLVMFVSERSRLGRYTYVYELQSPGFGTLDPSRKYPIRYKFRSRQPPFVDAAMFVDSQNGGDVYLLAGTRLYQYQYDRRSETFYLVDGSPTWLDVTGLPERPRAAVALPLDDSRTRHYVWIFGNTMVCDFDAAKGTIGSHCMPSQMFGRNMPQGLGGAVVLEDRNIYLFQQKQYFRFDMAKRSIADGYPKELGPSWIRGECGNGSL